jgi:hypothetical protein
MLFDVCIAILLFLATTTCWILARKIYRFKEVTSAITPNIHQVSGYVNQISKQIETFKNVSDQQKQFFTKNMPKAQALEDDLQTLLEHCEKIATRLDHLIDQATSVEKNLQDILISHVSRPTNNTKPFYTPNNQYTSNPNPATTASVNIATPQPQPTSFNSRY